MLVLFKIALLLAQKSSCFGIFTVSISPNKKGMTFIRNHFWLGLACILLSIKITGQETNRQETLTVDGAWCWFSVPRAIYKHKNSDEIVTGWVTSDGSIEAVIFNTTTVEKKIQTIQAAIDKDDHANPSFLELDNKDVLLTYTKHFDAGVRLHRLESNESKFGDENFIPVFNEEQFKLYPRKGVTYANPFSLSEEDGRIYCFGRWTGFKPNMMWSDDNGSSFSPAKVYITNKPFNDSNRPYVRYYSDGKSKIHIAFTDGHPRKEPTNSIYYAYYENGAFWRADGTRICTLENIPFEPREATMVYNATEESGRAWIYDITADKNGNPVIAYARYPEETEHLYHYTVYDDKKWKDQFLCNSGKWFPQTPEGAHEPEPHYSGGMAIHPLNTKIIYISREINGIFEIEKWESKNNKSWKKTAITSNSEYDNVRPVIPKNMRKGDQTILLWMVNEKYIHYNRYKTRIDYLTEH